MILWEGSAVGQLNVRHRPTRCGGVQILPREVPYTKSGITKCRRWPSGGLSLSLGTGQRDPQMSVNIIGRSGQLPVPSDERPFGALFLLRKPVAGSPTGLSG